MVLPDEWVVKQYLLKLLLQVFPLKFCSYLWLWSLLSSFLKRALGKSSRQMHEVHLIPRVLFLTWWDRSSTGSQMWRCWAQQSWAAAGLVNYQDGSCSSPTSIKMHNGPLSLKSRSKRKLLLKILTPYGAKSLTLQKMVSDAHGLPFKKRRVIRLHCMAV